ncbi:MAG: hypothetical protein AB7V77_04465 [Candidatus Woesearchaeota archaeon]
MEKHTTELYNYKGSIDDCARDIIHMRFDKTTEHINSLSKYLELESSLEEELNHPKTSNHLYWASFYQKKSAEHMQKAWKNCEPHMIQDKLNYSFNKKYLIPFIGGILACYFGNNIDSENLRMITQSFSLTISFTSFMGIFWDFSKN